MNGLREQKERRNGFVRKGVVHINNRNQLGIYAIGKIEKGQRILKVMGYKTRGKGEGKWCLDIGNGYFIKEKAAKGMWRFISHSCAPNCEIRNGFIYAIKTIKRDSEITVSYIREGEADYGKQVKDWFKRDGCGCGQC